MTRSTSRFRAAYGGLAIFLLLGLGVPSSDLGAQSNGATPVAIRTYSTISSIGVEWDIVGDLDHDATAAAEYRVVGAAAWRLAMPLVRVDYNGANMLAGSILFLDANAAYEVRLTLSDPDGGADVQIVTVATRPVPMMPLSGRSFHVVPGSSGGDGSLMNSFRGVTAAEVVARPGDTFLVHAGSYGGRITFTKPGTSSEYIVWKGAGDGEALFAGIDVAASYVWLEGLTLRDQPLALMSKNAPTGVVISRCSFFNNHYSIYLQRGGSNWYIADNTIVGDTPYATDSLDGEGIELNGYSVDSFVAVVHPPESARRLHGSAVQVPDDRSIGDRPQHDCDVGQDDLLQRRAPAAIDRQKQPVADGVRRADLGFRIDGEGLAQRFRQRRIRLGIEHGAVQVRGRSLLERCRFCGGVRSRDARPTEVRGRRAGPGRVRVRQPLPTYGPQSPPRAPTGLRITR